jgi:L-iditol 2-dehydrogenase
VCADTRVYVHVCVCRPAQPGQSVLITGAGPIGLVTLMVAKAFGATRIVVTGTPALLPPRVVVLQIPVCMCV